MTWAITLTGNGPRGLGVVQIRNAERRAGAYDADAAGDTIGNDADSEFGPMGAGSALSRWGGWGDVPADPEVRAFSELDAVRPGAPRNNKRHHFISVTYMNGFTDASSRVYAFRAEDSAPALHLAPRSIGYQTYYYSQKTGDGGQENHRFEDLWSPIESVWPETMRAVRGRRLSPAISFNLLGMASIMKARVPAARERNERLLAAKLRAEVQVAEELGLLGPELQRYAGQLDTVPVGVNPHQTLLAIMDDIRAFGDLCFQLGFEIIHNQTDVPFIASDNPVCIYDPEGPLHARRPYTYGKRVELIFPLDARTLLRGTNRLRPVNQVVRHRTMSDPAQARRMNRTVAQFSYRLVIASDRSSEAMIRRYASTVPTVEIAVRRTPKEVQIVWNHVFGPPPALSPFIDTPEKAARLEARMNAAPASPAG
jgi:hypothetical protein